MRSRMALLFRLLLIIAVCCATVAIAHADNTIPWLTGNFSIPDYIHGDFSIGQINGYINFGYVPVDLSGDEWCSPGPPYWSCTYSTKGNWTTTLMMGLENNGQYYTLFAGSTSGSYSGSGEVACLDFPACTVYEGGYQEYDEFSFSGGWNNGWISVGELSGNWSDFCTPECGDNAGWSGGGSMVTTTPEPSGIALFGSGILGFAGILRRKFLS